jgi:endonuclease/exonuclease/phosphatase family metal-dependent hydrolase
MGKEKIDYIFSDTIHTEIIDARVNKYHEGNRFPSDHFPVICDLLLR